MTLVQTFPLPRASGLNRGGELSLTRSVPKYLHQMSVAGRRPPGMWRGTARWGGSEV